MGRFAEIDAGCPFNAMGSMTVIYLVQNISKISFLEKWISS